MASTPPVGKHLVTASLILLGTALLYFAVGLAVIHWGLRHPSGANSGTGRRADTDLQVAWNGPGFREQRLRYYLIADFTQRRVNLLVHCEGWWTMLKPAAWCYAQAFGVIDYRWSDETDHHRYGWWW